MAGRRNRFAFAGVPILDGLRDADDLDRRAGRAIEPDVFAHRIRARPIVVRELLVHDRDTRRVRVSDARNPRPRTIGIPIV